MKTLISMTDFVLDCVTNAPIEEYHQVNETFVNKVVNYANFLKQPLKLEMFVPCDDEGLPLSLEGLTDSEGYVLDEIEFNEFEKAKEKVLFEGFRILDNKEQVFCTLGMGKLILTYEYKTKMFLLQKDWTVERLVKLSLILTPTALKQIGL